ncbi:hypothetical protein GOZ83_19860 [Agrobacterium vitis]|uniref:hypothetical protein n=1 Tax=Agrobacterium vitis TaxID=373 RepID=UPI0012E9903E|nr:hypothetical protein [Agrobacterium vitis]MVA47313.1 hypothetical protein [Agrobacterium vitis]
MATQEEKIAIVQRGVSAFAAIEQALKDVVESANALKSVYEDGAAAGMTDGHTAVLQIAEFNRWIGGVGEFEAKIYAAHARSTAIAKANDADSALPEGYVTIMGGGR